MVDPDHKDKPRAYQSFRNEQELLLAFFRIDIEFEKLFLQFFMPTIRGRDTGSKKRYAGLFINETGAGELYFAGMETTRRDWTALAKEFQVDLFTLLFK